MARILIADDQIPDDRVADDDVVASVSDQYPDAHRGFIEAFAVMRQAVNTLRDGCDVTAVNRFDEAKSLLQSERFDVVIIDLGWAGDETVARADERTAGRSLISIIQAEDAKHPERAPTSQIIYSSRFESDPSLGSEAAKRGVLPFYKPYGERHSLPLGGEPEDRVSGRERVRVASESLRAIVKFIVSLRDSKIERLLQSTQEALARANERERRWDIVTLIMTIIGVLIVFAGVLASFVGTVQQGVVTAASGVVLALIPRLLYGRVDTTYKQSQQAQGELIEVLKRSLR